MSLELKRLKQKQLKKLNKVLCINSEKRSIIEITSQNTFNPLNWLAYKMAGLFSC